MSRDKQRRRDKEVTREIHKLFWRADFQDKWGVPITLLTRIPAFALVHVFMPLSTAYAVNAIVNRDFTKVSSYVWQIIWLAVGFGVLWVISSIFVTRNGVTAGAYLQEKVFANYLDKDYEFYGNNYLGSLGAQATRLRQALVNEYNMVMFLQIPKQVVVIGGGILVISFYSLSLALITLVMMAIVLSFTVLSGRFRLKWRRVVSEQESAVAADIGDALTHAPAVKSFAQEDYEVGNLRQTLKSWQHAQHVSWLTSVPADTVRYLLVAATTAVLLIMTSRMYQDNSISFVIVTLLQLYVIKMIAATVDINEIIKTYESAMGSAYQPVVTMMAPRHILDATDAVDLPHHEKYGVDFKDVRYRYSDMDPKAVAVHDFSLQIKPGEKVGLVGYSGSGKSTITKLMLRFMDLPDGGGNIAIADKDIRSLKQKSLRQSITYVPQEPILFHRSIYENIAYGKPGASRKEVLEVARMAHVDEFASAMPQQYDTLVGERGVKLSGGQRQRVAIARAILKDAPIIMLDEATSALDSRSEKLIQDAIWKLVEKRTALVIAHRLSTLQQMDRIVVMDKGKIMQVGTHAKLLKDKNGIYAELWSHQSGGYIGVPTPNTEK